MPTPPMTATEAYDAFKARKTFGNLDGLRALSIIIVIWHHTAGEIPGLPGTGRGFLGVDMFFALSGFLIVTLVLRERARNGQISLKRFYMRRTLRIFPLYYLVVLLVGVMCVLRRSEAFNLDSYLDLLPFYLTYTSNWAPADERLVLSVAWSLAAEEQFYIVWPPLERFAKKLALPVLAVAIVYNQLINFELVPMPFGLDRLEHAILQATFTPILLGVGLAHALHHKNGFAAVYRLLGHRAAPLAIFATLFVVGSIPNADIGGVHRFSLQVLMTLLLASVVVREDGIGTPLMRTKPVIRFGQVSYGLYLWHMMVRPFAFAVVAKLGLGYEPAQIGRFVLFGLVTVGTFVVSELSFRFFEMPFLKLKARFAV